MEDKHSVAVHSNEGHHFIVRCSWYEAGRSFDVDVSDGESVWTLEGVL